LSQYAGLRLGYAMTPAVPDLSELLGTGAVVARVLNQVFDAVVNALFGVFAMVLLKMIVRRESLVGPVGIGLVMLLAVRGMFDGGSVPANIAAGLCIVTIIILTIQRLGLVATLMLFLVDRIMSSAATTFDSSKWFFADSLLLVAIPTGLALYGFYVSRGGEPLLGKPVLD